MAMQGQRQKYFPAEQVCANWRNPWGGMVETAEICGFRVLRIDKRGRAFYNESNLFNKLNNMNN